MEYVVYTDGSFNPNTPDKTYGAVIVLRKAETGLIPVLAQRYVIQNKLLVDARNAGGELAAAVLAIGSVGVIARTDVQGDKYIIHLYHDYVGVAKFVTGEWKASKPSGRIYLASLQKMKEQHPYADIKYHWVKSHSGNLWNGYVDAIARTGRFPEACKDVALPDHVVG